MSEIQIQHEQRRSFDPLASVDLYQYDLMMYGRVLPETEARVHDEELTYIAEGLNRPLYTQFKLQEQGGELQMFDRGAWVSYVSILERGKQTAEQEALVDARKQFAHERTATDLYHGYQMHKLAPGESMAWVSPYPQDVEDRYGAAFVSSLGYQPTRKMGFLYYAEKLDSGEVVLHTQSVDNSDDAAFGAALDAGQEGIVAMREHYDAVMTQKQGEKHYAGRKETAFSPENAWELIHQHRDLLGYYFDELKQLANQTDLPRTELETAKKRLTYGVWAALKGRIDGTVTRLNKQRATPAIGYDPIALGFEVQTAYQDLSAKGEVLFGCGGAIRGEAALLDADSKDVFEAVFSDSGSDKYGSLKFKCQRGHTNMRPKNQLIPRCKTCGISVAC